MAEFGNHYLLHISQELRDRVRAFFGTVLDCVVVGTDDVTRDIPENVDLFVFPGGETLGVQFVESDALVLSNSEHRNACWLEIKTDDVESLKRKLLEFGVDEITDFWDSDHFYFHAPGGTGVSSSRSERATLMGHG